ncbi:cation diffusion facilitator family transporter [Candidatus Parcubacteria bacterium]|nr:cation diffusion facilitator family transporter [Candidatus Parcubacteria bacterium]
MTPQSVSIISVFVNLGLGIAKLFFGFLTGSVALIADGIHSSLDVFSSFVTFLGLRTAKKPIDEKHPYGYWKAESLAGFLVAILLAISGIWILYEAVMRIFGEGTVELSIGAIAVVVISIVVTEILARLKFYYGGKFKSLALVADAEHSRADALSSIGVLIGLFLAPYFNLADAVIALFIGGYILFESWQIGKEITDSLLDVANKDVEQRIRKICVSHQIEIAELKTRMIGSFNFAEIKIKLPPKLKVEQVQKITETLEDRLLNNIPELKQIIISIEAYNMAKTIVSPKLGKKIGDLKGFEKIGPEKIGERTIIPIEKQEIAPQFGSSEYLIIDQKESKILLKKFLKNPYFNKDLPHGARFAKTVRADKVITREIGPNAKQGLENFGIKVRIVPDKNLNGILKLIENNAKEN